MEAIVDMLLVNNSAETPTVELDLLDNEDEFFSEDDAPDYNNYMKFDRGLWSVDARVNNLAEFLCDEMGYSLTVGKMNMIVIVLNLYKCCVLDASKWVAYSRSPGKYLFIFRYNQHRVSYRPTIKIVEYLKREGYIDAKIGYRDPLTKVTRLSRMSATSKLADLFHGYGFTSDLLRGPRYTDVIQLKDENKKPKEYSDNSRNRAKQKRDIVQRYNALLDRTYIDLDTEGYVPRKCSYVDMSRKQVHRVFSNGRWDQGGRFYGGFWMSIPESLRTRIIINNMEVMEFDFKGMHIKMLYAMEGIPYEIRDPYNIPGYPPGVKMRKFLKILFLILINTDNANKVKGALDKEIYKDPESYPEFNERPNLGNTIELIKQHHAPIANHILSARGLGLQYIDSMIAEKVINTFTIENIPILSIHDSFIVPRDYKDMLTTVMTDAYKAHGNLSINNIVMFKYSKRYIYSEEKEIYHYDIESIADTALKNRMLYYHDSAAVPDSNYQISLHSAECSCISR
jgi:hypothetical protein